MMRLRRGEKSRGLRIYYASDVHGSDVLWKKFLNAGKHYGCSHLIMGGDLMGKAIVPIIQTNGSHSAWVVGEERRATTPEELDEIVRAIRLNGFYPFHTTPEEHQAMRDNASLREQLFMRAMLEDLERWIDLAAERLAGTEEQLYVMPGNDDPWQIDEVLERNPIVHSVDGKVVEVGGHEMLSCGFANPTPWDSPRELSEEDLYKKLRGLADQLSSPSTAVFNLHVPPYDSGLDTAMEIDEELRPVLKSGRPNEIPVGSTAVRQLLEEFQPALSLHGHIHESRGITHIGRTVAINPGSDYSSGRLEGCIVDLAEDGVRHFQLLSG
jgi:Icc-related predicted phosphoesterase